VPGGREGAREPEQRRFAILFRHVVDGTAVPDRVAQRGELGEADLQAVSRTERRIPERPALPTHQDVLQLAEVAECEQLALVAAGRAGVSSAFVLLPAGDVV